MRVRVQFGTSGVSEFAWGQCRRYVGSLNATEKIHPGRVEIDSELMLEGLKPERLSMPPATTVLSRIINVCRLGTEVVMSNDLLQRGMSTARNTCFYVIN